MENEKNLEEVQEEVTPVQEPVPTEEPTTAVEETPAESATEETASAEEAAPAEETAEETAVQETPAEESKPEEKKATPGKMALVIGAIVVVAAVIIALLMGGKEAPPAGQTTPSTAPVETTEPVPTIPADGNPDDETCKGTYTVSDEEIVALRDTVVATIGDNTLTNGQLQTFYWMQVQSFLASEYGSTMMYYGMLDYTQPLDMQSSVMAEGRTWQQFFLKEALNSWQSYAALSEEAEAAGMILSEEVFSC